MKQEIFSFMRKSRFLRKGTALFVSVCFLFSESASYAWLPAAPAVTGIRGRDEAGLTIPSEFGILEEFHQGMSGKTIIYIQDAHTSIEAQENIAKIIAHLVENYGIKTVFEEGYEGPVPSDEYFGQVEDREIRGKVAYTYMDQLRIGGAEFAHINRRRDFNLVGADSVELLLESIHWYKESSERGAEIMRDLGALESTVKKLADRYFPKALKDWLKLKKRHDEKHIPLLEYLKRTISFFPAGRDELRTYPNLSLLLSVERAQDKEAAEKAEQMDAMSLFEEINLLENALARELLDNERDRRIFYYGKMTGLLKRLAAVEVTAPEYQAIKDSLAAVNTQEIAAFIVGQTGKSLVLSKRWEANIRHAVRFYELAQERDRLLEERLLKHFNGNERSAALVFGGFHKDNIKEILRRNGFSYHIVTPRITEISERHESQYRRLMAGGIPEEAARSYVSTAARYIPIFVDGEYFGDRDSVKSQILRQAEDLGYFPERIRSELRSDQQEPGPRPGDPQEILKLQDFLQKRAEDFVMQTGEKTVLEGDARGLAKNFLTELKRNVALPVYNRLKAVLQTLYHTAPLEPEHPGEPLRRAVYRLLAHAARIETERTDAGLLTPDRRAFLKFAGMLFHAALAGPSAAADAATQWVRQEAQAQNWLNEKQPLITEALISRMSVYLDPFVHGDFESRANRGLFWTSAEWEGLSPEKRKIFSHLLLDVYQQMQAEISGFLKRNAATVRTLWELHSGYYAPGSSLWILEDFPGKRLYSSPHFDPEQDIIAYRMAAELEAGDYAVMPSFEWSRPLKTVLRALEHRSGVYKSFVTDLPEEVAKDVAQELPSLPSGLRDAFLRGRLRRPFEATPLIEKKVEFYQKKSHEQAESLALQAQAIEKKIWSPEGFVFVSERARKIYEQWVSEKETASSLGHTLEVLKGLADITKRPDYLPARTKRSLADTMAAFKSGNRSHANALGPESSRELDVRSFLRSELRAKVILTQNALEEEIEKLGAKDLEIGGNVITGWAVSTETRSSHAALHILADRLRAAYPKYRFEFYQDFKTDQNFLRLDIIPPTGKNRRSELRSEPDDVWSRQWDREDQISILGEGFELEREAATKFFEAFFLEVLQRESNAKFIDLGTGRLFVPKIGLEASRRIPAAEPEFHGLDSAPLEPAMRPEDPRIHFHQAKLEGMQDVFEDGFFDAATSSFGLEYAENLSRSLDALHGILKPGAPVAMVLHHRNSVIAESARERFWEMEQVKKAGVFQALLDYVSDESPAHADAVLDASSMLEEAVRSAAGRDTAILEQIKDQMELVLMAGEEAIPALHKMQREFDEYYQLFRLFLERVAVFGDSEETALRGLFQGHGFEVAELTRLEAEDTRHHQTLLAGWKIRLSRSELRKSGDGATAPFDLQDLFYQEIGTPAQTEERLSFLDFGARYGRQVVALTDDLRRGMGYRKAFGIGIDKEPQSIHVYQSGIRLGENYAVADVTKLEEDAPSVLERGPYDAVVIAAPDLKHIDLKAWLEAGKRYLRENGIFLMSFVPAEEADFKSKILEALEETGLHYHWFPEETTPLLYRDSHPLGTLVLAKKTPFKGNYEIPFSSRAELRSTGPNSVNPVGTKEELRGLRRYGVDPASPGVASISAIEPAETRQKIKSFLSFLEREYLGDKKAYGRRFNLILKHGPYTLEQLLDLIDTTYKVLGDIDGTLAVERYQAVSLLLLMDVKESYLRKIFGKYPELFDRDLGRDYQPDHRAIIEEGVDPGYFWYDSTVSDGFRDSIEEIEKVMDYGSAEVVLHALSGVGRDAFLMAQRWPGIKIFSLDANVFNLREALERLEEERAAGNIYPNLRFLHADARVSRQGIPLPDQSVDKVVFIGLAAASMLPGEVSEITQEILRVTRREGGLVFFDFDTKEIPAEIADAVRKRPDLGISHRYLRQIGEMVFPAHILTLAPAQSLREVWAILREASYGRQLTLFNEFFESRQHPEPLLSELAFYLLYHPSHHIRHLASDKIAAMQPAPGILIRELTKAEINPEPFGFPAGVTAENFNPDFARLNRRHAMIYTLATILTPEEGVSVPEELRQGLRRAVEQEAEQWDADKDRALWRLVQEDPERVLKAGRALGFFETLRLAVLRHYYFRQRTGGEGRYAKKDAWLFPNVQWIYPSSGTSRSMLDENSRPAARLLYAPAPQTELRSELRNTQDYHDVILRAFTSLGRRAERTQSFREIRSLPESLTPELEEALTARLQAGLLAAEEDQVALFLSGLGLSGSRLYDYFLKEPLMPADLAAPAPEAESWLPPYLTEREINPESLPQGLLKARNVLEKTQRHMREQNFSLPVFFVGSMVSEESHLPQNLDLVTSRGLYTRFIGEYSRFWQSLRSEALRDVPVNKNHAGGLFEFLFLAVAGSVNRYGKAYRITPERIYEITFSEAVLNPFLEEKIRHYKKRLDEGLKFNLSMDYTSVHLPGTGNLTKYGATASVLSGMLMVDLGFFALGWGLLFFHRHQARRQEALRAQELEALLAEREDITGKDMRAPRPWMRQIHYKLNWLEHAAKQEEGLPLKAVADHHLRIVQAIEDGVPEGEAWIAKAYLDLIQEIFEDGEIFSVETKKKLLDEQIRRGMVDFLGLAPLAEDDNGFVPLEEIQRYIRVMREVLPGLERDESSARSELRSGSLEPEMAKLLKKAIALKDETAFRALMKIASAKSDGIAVRLDESGRSVLFRDDNREKGRTVGLALPDFPRMQVRLRFHKGKDGFLWLRVFRADGDVLIHESFYDSEEGKFLHGKEHFKARVLRGDAVPPMTQSIPIHRQENNSARNYFAFKHEGRTYNLPRPMDARYKGIAEDEDLAVIYVSARPYYGKDVVLGFLDPDEEEPSRAFARWEWQWDAEAQRYKFENVHFRVPGTLIWFYNLLNEKFNPGALYYARLDLDDQGKALIHKGLELRLGDMFKGEARKMPSSVVMVNSFREQDRVDVYEAREGDRERGRWDPQGRRFIASKFYDSRNQRFLRAWEEITRRHNGWLRDESLKIPQPVILRTLKGKEGRTGAHPTRILRTPSGEPVYFQHHVHEEALVLVRFAQVEKDGISRRGLEVYALNENFEPQILIKRGFYDAKTLKFRWFSPNKRKPIDSRLKKILEEEILSLGYFPFYIEMKAQEARTLIAAFRRTVADEEHSSRPDIEKILTQFNEILAFMDEAKVFALKQGWAADALDEEFEKLSLETQDIYRAFKLSENLPDGFPVGSRVDFRGRRGKVQGHGFRNGETTISILFDDLLAKPDTDDHVETYSFEAIREELQPLPKTPRSELRSTVQVLRDLQGAVLELDISGLTVLLFGSRADDRHHDDSDLDLMLFLSEEAVQPQTAISEIKDRFTEKMHAKGYHKIEIMDLHPATRENYFKLWKQRRWFMRNRHLWFVSQGAIEGFRLTDDEVVPITIEEYISERAAGPKEQEIQPDDFESLVMEPLKKIHPDVNSFVSARITTESGDEELEVLFAGSNGYERGYILRKAGPVLFIDQNFKPHLPLEELDKKFTVLFVSEASPQFRPVTPTNLVIASLYRIRAQIQGKVFIDFGAGKLGNIGLFAGKLGAKEVLFVERDLTKHESIRENAENNGIPYRILESVSGLSAEEINGSIVAQNLGYDFGIEDVSRILSLGTPEVVVSAGGFLGEHREVVWGMSDKVWKHSVLQAKASEHELPFAAVISARKEPGQDAGSRSELRKEALAGSVDQMTVPAGVFLDAGELVQLKEDQAEEYFEELLILVQKHKAFDIYIDGTERYPLADIRIAKFQKLWREHPGRVHLAQYSRAHLSKKKVLVHVSFFENNDTLEETRETISRIKEKYHIQEEIIPMEYTRSGAVTAFLSLAESLTAAALIHEIGEAFATRGPNGRWRIAETFADALWNRLQAAYIIQWSA